MTSSNTFQSDIGSLQNGGHGEDIIKARLELFMYNLSIFRFWAFLFFSFFFRPTDPLSLEGGRWETKHFMGMALPVHVFLVRDRDEASLNYQYYY